MKLLNLRIQNYRSIHDLSLNFPRYYTALCGRNDAGKSNIIRALQHLFLGREKSFHYSPEMSVKDDFPKWGKDGSSKFIAIDVEIELHSNDDEGLYRFLLDYLSGIALSQDAPLRVRITARYTTDQLGPKVAIKVADQPLEDLKSQEVLKRLQSSSAVAFHDSTEFMVRFEYVQESGLFDEVSADEAKLIDEARDRLHRTLSRVAKRNQTEISEILGRLKDQHKIGLSVSRLDPSELPYSITLGSEPADVELEKWGSGTQNRTGILMTLFRAKRARSSATSASKITPVIIVEEPESYLHPSAQAEFGVLLRDLAEEFKVQVIVATHSPYLLSLTEPEANILLGRQTHRKKVLDTYRIDTSGDGWMEPFSLALGVAGSELAPWRDALFTKKDSVLLVEGDTDREYMSLLQHESHGENRLKFEGDIFAYGGKDTLKQKQLLRFIRAKFKTFIVTYDLDAEAEVEGHLKDIGLIKAKDYMPIGKDAPGKQSIEGLLPESVFQAVYGNNVDLVQKATCPVPTESRRAKNALKKLYLEEFKRIAAPGTDGMKSFYSLTRQLNRMIE